MLSTSVCRQPKTVRKLSIQLLLVDRNNASPAMLIPVGSVMVQSTMSAISANLDLGLMWMVNVSSAMTFLVFTSIALDGAKNDVVMGNDFLNEMNVMTETTLIEMDAALHVKLNDPLDGTVSLRTSLQKASVQMFQTYMST